MDLTADQRAVRAAAREVAAEAVRPSAAECDREETFPEDAWDRLAERGLTGLTVPESHGGLDADPVTYALVNEAVAEGSLAVATALSVHALATDCIATFADPSVQSEWLPEMADGRPVGAFALSEPHAGSNPREMSTVARDEGDGYVLDGEKQWITNGERSGVVVVFAKTDPADPDSITQFLVPKDADGLSVGDPEEKLGLRASDTTSLTLDGVSVPDRYRLTEEGRGLAAALSVLTRGRVGIAAQAVGLSRAALDEAVDYVRTNECRSGPLADVQSVRHRVAEMWTTVRAARALTLTAARALDREVSEREGDDQADEGQADDEQERDEQAADRSRNDDPGTTGDREDRATARALASAAKYFATEGAVEVTGEAVQLHGGEGAVSPGAVERFYRDAKVTTIYEGTTQIQKDVIGRSLLE